MAYESMYGGGKYGLEPGVDSMYRGTSLSAGSLGAPTSIQTANQISEVSNLLNTGLKAVEVSALTPDVFDMIPKQHIKEIERLAKINNIDISLHGPTLDPSGFTQQGWNEQNREEVERQLSDVVRRGHELNPNKPMPITIHASMIPGSERMPTSLLKGTGLLSDAEKKLESVQTQMIAVNQQTGELVPLRRELKHIPGKPEGYLRSPEEELDVVNVSHWDNKLSNLIFYKERGDELLTKNKPLIAAELAEMNKKLEKAGKLTPEKFQEIQQQFNNSLSDTQRAALGNYQNAGLYLENTHQTLNNLFNEAYKAADDKTKEELEQLSKICAPGLHKRNADPQAYSQALQGLITGMQNLTSGYDSETGKSRTIELYKPIEVFAKDKASQTFANVAFNAYDKFKDKAPIISIENPPYGQALATGKDLKELILQSREKLAKKLVSESKMGQAQADNIAKNMIGATWDTSHISMMRKQGFEGKQLIEEAKAIAPVVKHVHLNDNLGMTHTDLPPGMGTAELGEVMKEFQKKGYKGKEIFEGGNWFQHFKSSPTATVMEGTGSPLYSLGPSPSWTNVYGTTGNYSVGYGPFLPDQHFSIYGAGFSGLPQELGGQVGNRSSRLSGTPNA
jgi:sugar phosphate isomerase/epimerase